VGGVVGGVESAGGGGVLDEALEAAVFNAAGDERTGTAFWLTSMLNEAVVHGFDAANAAGTARAEVDGDIAAALISNHLAMLISPTWELQRPASAQAIRGTGQKLQWQATDVADGWFVERRADGAVWEEGNREADVTITRPAGSLLLAMTRRIPLTDREAGGISIDGDVDLAQHWLDNTAHVTN
jgi:SCP-2 sterol transfer family protein